MEAFLTPSSFGGPNSSGPAVVSYASDESLDIRHFLTPSSHDAEALLSTTFSLGSIDSIRSLAGVPPFKLVAPLHSLQLKYSPILSIGDQRSKENQALFSTTITVPTPPRLEAMLMEPICVSHWNTHLISQAPPKHIPWDDKIADSCISPPWIPQGSIFPPEAFETILRHKRLSSQSICASVTQHDGSCEAFAPKVEPVGHRTPKSASGLPGSSSGPIEAAGESPLTEDLPTTGSALPTITISNSSAVFSVPSVSSQDLLSHVPLAIRRGRKPPAPLSLSPVAHNQAGHKGELGFYPDIPTPFRGSPSINTPVFQLVHNSNAASMDLNAMCEDLRSRCPPLRPDTPQPMSVAISPLIASDVIPDDPEPEEDEWAFAKDMLAEFGGTPCSPGNASAGGSDRVSLGPCPNDAGEVDSCDFSWANTETFADSRDEDPSAPYDTATSYTPKQQRRKTVIIETPDSSLRRRTRVTLDLSHLSGHCDDESTHDQHAIPFETPTSAVSFSPDRFSSSTRSRPSSSATMRPPVKGILKGRKSVRFSVVPSMHEYPSEGQIAPESPASPTLKSLNRSPRIPRTSVTCNSKVKLGSPLRQSFVADSPSTKPSPHRYRATFPKHPAVQAIIKNSTFSSSPTASSPSSPLSPTIASRRIPLRPKNDRQSLPSPLGSPNARKSISVEDVGSPKRLKPLTSRRPPSQRMSTTQDENSARRESSFPALQKTRSTGSSLRSIFTKLRA